MKKVFVIEKEDNVGTAVGDPIQVGDTVGTEGRIKEAKASLAQTEDRLRQLELAAEQGHQQAGVVYESLQNEYYSIGC